MSKKKNIHENETGFCPVGEIFQEMEKLCGKKSEFMNHLRQSRLECLKAIKCLVDAGIERLEAKTVPAKKKKAVKIEVE